MSYREEGNSVILTMSKEDYELLLDEMNYLADRTVDRSLLRMLNRVNSGNPHFMPYKVERDNPDA